MLVSDPHAKKAAKTEGLDDNRSALLKAAAAKGRKAQLAKIKELSAQRSKAKTKRSAKAVALSTKDKECLDGLLESWKRSEELVRAFVGAPDNVAEEFLTRIRQMRREAIAKDPKSWRLIGRPSAPHNEVCTVDLPGVWKCRGVAFIWAVIPGKLAGLCQLQPLRTAHSQLLPCYFLKFLDLV